MKVMGSNPGYLPKSFLLYLIYVSIVFQAMGFMMRSLTGDWKFWIYFDVDMKLQYIEEFYEKIAEFESTSAIVKSITCDQG